MTNNATRINSLTLTHPIKADDAADTAAKNEHSTHCRGITRAVTVR